MSVTASPYDVLVETWAKVTPFPLRVGRSSCPAWLDNEVHRDPAPGPFFRWDIRTRLLMRLRQAHAAMHAPEVSDLGSVPGGLLPEQRWYYERFANTYCGVFAGDPGRDRPHGCDSVTTLNRRHLNVAGAVDLLLDLPHGAIELRQFELWGRRICADPYESWEIALALIRLFCVNPDLSKLAVRHVDLLSGEVDIYASILASMSTRSPSVSMSRSPNCGLARRRLSPSPAGRAGTAESPVHVMPWDDRPRARQVTVDPTRREFVGPIVRLTPTSIMKWLRCPRLYRAAHLLDLPVGPRGAGSERGIIVHSALARLHEDGPCSPDPAQRIEAASVQGLLDESLLGYLRRHARRCPTSARSIGHEVDLAQLHTWGPVPVMVTARIDAMWEHNGTLLCRDYKTGMPWGDRVADDPAARLQAWLLAHHAAERGLHLELRYEHLAEGVDEDPEPFEPDEDDIAEIQYWIGQLGADIAQSDFAGVGEADICRRCVYRRACPDAVLEDEGFDDGVLIRVVSPAEPTDCQVLDGEEEDRNVDGW